MTVPPPNKRLYATHSPLIVERVLPMLMVAALGCTRTDVDQRRLPESVSPSTNASASQTPEAQVTDASAAPTEPVIPVILTRTVSAGDVPVSHAWMPSFTLERSPDDLGATLVLAQESCATKALQLCTESQWHRACLEDPKIGAVETWTATSDGERGFVVRGGATCATRSASPGSQISPTRAGVCCSPAVGIVTDSRNKAFLMATSDRQAKFQRSLNAKDTPALAEAFDDEAKFFRMTLSREAIAKHYDNVFQQWPRQWTIFERCSVTLQAAAETYTADCLTLAGRNDAAASVIQRHVRGGPQNKLQSLTEVRVNRGFSAR